MAVEAGIADYWYKYVGLNGAIVGMTTFGESAPAEQLFAEFGFTVDNVVAKAQALLKQPGAADKKAGHRDRLFRFIALYRGTLL